MALQRVNITVELSTGETHDISITNASLVAWDRTRTKRQWPPVDQAPSLWMTFIAWHHMKAAGLIPENTSYDDFESTLCVAVGDPDEQAKALAEAKGETWEGDLVPPTEPSPEPAYSSS